MVAGLLVACSGGGVGSSPGTDDDGLDRPTAADEAIFTIEYAGGFVPVHFAATQTPAFVLLGDGRVIVQGAMTLEYPGPALPPLVERRLTAEGIDQVLDAIIGTNLFDADLDLRGAMNMVADASDTIFTLRAGGEEVTVSVYGLGTLAPMPGMEPPEGISEAEIRAHATLQELSDSLLMLDTWLPTSAFADDGWRPYEPEAFRLYVRELMPGEVDPQFATEREWPAEATEAPNEFGEVQETFGDGTRCGVVEGDAAQAWLTELQAATQATVWTAGDAVYSVLPRPLLPHEDAACPELVGA